MKRISLLQKLPVTDLKASDMPTPLYQNWQQDVLYVASTSSCLLQVLTYCSLLHYLTLTFIKTQHCEFITPSITLLKIFCGQSLKSLFRAKLFRECI